jgi:hypothetical protein
LQLQFRDHLFFLDLGFSLFNGEMFYACDCLLDIFMSEKAFFSREVFNIEEHQLIGLKNFAVQNGESVEAVIMRYDTTLGKYDGKPRSGGVRSTLCVSSQVNIFVFLLDRTFFPIVNVLPEDLLRSLLSSV